MCFMDFIVHQKKLVYDENMTIRVGHTVEFINNEAHLYGIVDEVKQVEEEKVYTIFAKHRLFKNVKQNEVIHDYGVIE